MLFIVNLGCGDVRIDIDFTKDANVLADLNKNDPIRRESMDPVYSKKLYKIAHRPYARTI